MVCWHSIQCLVTASHHQFAPMLRFRHDTGAPEHTAEGRQSAYGATKGAVMRLTESLADELRPDRIRVSAVLPTTIDTPQNRAAMPGADVSRWVKPSEVAEAIAFLLSGHVIWQRRDPWHRHQNCQNRTVLERPELQL
jgi:NAD(P)-dependent dehydrogenase (short-subunit alcohol dehydrogenase family)